MVPNTACLPFYFLALVHNTECKFILGFEPVTIPCTFELCKHPVFGRYSCVVSNTEYCDYLLPFPFTMTLLKNKTLEKNSHSFTDKMGQIFTENRVEWK